MGTDCYRAPTEKFCSFGGGELLEKPVNIRGVPAFHLRFYLDPDTGEPHILEHGVSETEVSEVLTKPMETVRGRNGTSIGHGQTKSGRWLKVVYTPDDDGEGLFVITAFDLPAKQVAALKRRIRRR